MIRVLMGFLAFFAIAMSHGAVNCKDYRNEADGVVCLDKNLRILDKKIDVLMKAAKHKLPSDAYRSVLDYYTRWWDFNRPYESSWDKKPATANNLLINYRYFISNIEYAISSDWTPIYHVYENQDGVLQNENFDICYDLAAELTKKKFVPLYVEDDLPSLVGSDIHRIEWHKASLDQARHAMSSNAIEAGGQPEFFVNYFFYEAGGGWTFYKAKDAASGISILRRSNNALNTMRLDIGSGGGGDILRYREVYYQYSWGFGDRHLTLKRLTSSGDQVLGIADRSYSLCSISNLKN